MKNFFASGEGFRAKACETQRLGPIIRCFEQPGPALRLKDAGHVGFCSLCPFGLCSALGKNNR